MNSVFVFAHQHVLNDTTKQSVFVCCLAF